MRVGERVYVKNWRGEIQEYETLSRLSDRNRERGRCERMSKVTESARASEKLGEWVEGGIRCAVE